MRRVRGGNAGVCRSRKRSNPIVCNRTLPVSLRPYAATQENPDTCVPQTMIDRCRSIRSPWSSTRTMLLPNDHSLPGASARLCGSPDSRAVEERAREFARDAGRPGEVKPEDRARAWAETLEVQWLQVADTMPLAQFFRTFCARAMRGMARAERLVSVSTSALGK